MKREYRIIQKMVVAMGIAREELVLLNFWGDEEETADLELFERAFNELGIHTIAVVHSQKSFEEMNRFTVFLEEQLELFHRQEQELLAADCKDEPDFVKIKSNVCGICKSFYQVACKKENKDAICTEYIRLLDKLIAEWKQSYEKAKEFDDAKKIVVEEAKLEVIEMMKQKFEEIRGTYND